MKLKNKHIQSVFDNECSDCYNSYVSIVPSQNMESFLDFMISLFENKQEIIKIERNSEYGQKRRYIN